MVLCLRLCRRVARPRCYVELQILKTKAYMRRVDSWCGADVN